MGMAASQARFLGLTARKTNVEYEGQQINQQRTTLSNTTANYYNDLLGMTVPVPPSVEDYTKTVYTFKDGSLTNSISSMIAQNNGTYLISYTSNWVDDFSIVAAPPAKVTRVSGTLVYTNNNYTNATTVNGVENTTVNYLVGATVMRNIIKRSDSTIDGYSQGDLNAIRQKDEYLNTLSDDQLKRLLKEENEYLSILNKEYGGDIDNETGESDWMVRYVKNTSANTWEPQFVKKTDLDSDDNTVYDENGGSLSYIPMYKIGALERNEEIKGVNARLEQDASGRIINVTLHPDQPDEVTYAVTTSTITDQAKYDDAMNQYEYDKAQYDQTIQEINAKIEIIQAEDKNLELRLKQLDTEQDAISTEMDAVQKIIEKNTESTFKTFG